MPLLIKLLYLTCFCCIRIMQSGLGSRALQGSSAWSSICPRSGQSQLQPVPKGPAAGQMLHKQYLVKTTTDEMVRILAGQYAMWGGIKVKDWENMTIDLCVNVRTTFHSQYVQAWIELHFLMIPGIMKIHIIIVSFSNVGCSARL